jgi:poly(U)-specific endoribonuclease
MHNWIQLYYEEQKNRLKYLGFVKPKKRIYYFPDEQKQIASINFIWRDCVKKVSSSFFGTTPEFELSLFTLNFFTSTQVNVVRLV